MTTPGPAHRLEDVLLRLRPDQIARFAEASGDHNPLHTDADLAARGPYGRPIAHGALTVIAALAAVPPAALSGEVVVRFPRPVLPGTDYRVDVQERGDTIAVTVSEGGLPAASVSVRTGAPFDGPGPASGADPGPCAVAPFADHPPRSVGAYGVARVASLRSLAEELGAGGIPDALLGALAWSSWYAGMRLPGRDCLLSGLRLRPGPPAPGYTAVLRAADPRTGAVIVDADLPGVGVELRAFHRLPVPAPTWERTTARRRAGDGLAGERVLVVGGSRGLGAAVAGALATQGAAVWAGYHRDTAAAAALRTEFGDRITPLRMDAADPGQAALRAAGLSLTGVVLCAGPSVRPIALHPDTGAAIGDFVDRSVAMAVHPLAVAAERLRPGGWLVAVSSSTVEDHPAHWPHYSMAKAAVEALAAHCARARGLRALVLRPPRLRTEMAAGPLGAVDAVDPEQVADHVLGWLLAGGPAGEVSTLGSAELRQPTATA